LNDLAQAAISKSGEELVNIKIQELALSKLLVLNYGKSDFRLVLAHYHLGEAYLGFDCLEQAIEHVSLALHKIEKLTPEIPRAELVQINMYITLAEAFMAQGNFDDAIEILGKAASL
jgi:tetratricopeptide (TPR) repeat protein